MKATIKKRKAGAFAKHRVLFFVRYSAAKVADMVPLGEVDHVFQFITMLVKARGDCPN